MPIMEWSDDLVVDEGPIDAQHKGIIELVNRLDDEVASGKGLAELGTVLTMVEQYTKNHFAMEEALMVKHAYPELAAHRMLHAVLLAEFRRLQRHHGKGTPMKPEDIVKFFEVWLREHIAKTDKQLGVFLASKRGKP